MSKNNLFSFLSTAALALFMVSQAGATTITIGGTTVAGEGVESSVAGAQTVTFDGLSTLPTGFSSMGTTPANPLVSGNSNTVYAAPTGDTSTYLTTGTGFIFDQPGTGVSYFGFYWGSLDTFNVIGLTDSNGNYTQYTGAQIASMFNLTANGTTSYYVNFFADPGTTFTTAGFGSNGYSFEIDNVATVTPEPGTVALLAGGLLIVAGALRRRKA